MRKGILFLLAVLTVFWVKAQPQATEGSTDFQKTQQPAAIITLPYPANIVEKAIDDYMAKKGIKGNDNKGYKIFRTYKLAATHDFNSDLYFKIERKSRTEKDLTMVYLVVGRNTEDIKTRKLNDSTGNRLGGAKELLNEMVPSIEAYNLEMQIKAQQDIAIKAQKKLDGLVDDQKSAEKKIRNLEDKLAQNKIDQYKQTDNIKDNIHNDEKAMAKAQKKLRNLVDDEADYQKSIRTNQDKIERSKRDQTAQQEEISKQKGILDTLTGKRKTS